MPRMKKFEAPLIDCCGPNCKAKLRATLTDKWIWMTCEGHPIFCSFSCVRDYAELEAQKEWEEVGQ